MSTAVDCAMGATQANSSKCDSMTKSGKNGGDIDEVRAYI